MTHWPIPCGCMVIIAANRPDEYLRECEEHEHTSTSELGRLIATYYSTSKAVPVTRIKMEKPHD